MTEHSCLREDRFLGLDGKLKANCDSAINAHHRIDDVVSQSVSKPLFFWVVGGLSFLFILVVGFHSHKLLSIEDTVNRMDRQLAVICDKVGIQGHYGR